MLPIIPATAKLSDFNAPMKRILLGDQLKKIRAIERSILRYGLFNPLVVMKEGNRLVVIDGRKRLTALRRMRFKGKLPRSLVRVPYIVIDQCRKLDPEMADNPLKLWSNAEAYEQVKDLRRRGRSPGQIASTLFASRVFVRGILAVDRLSQHLKRAFFGDQLSFDQARALSTLPNPKMQDALMQALGPFADAKDILKASAKVQAALYRKSRKAESGAARVAPKRNIRPAPRLAAA